MLYAAPQHQCRFHKLPVRFLDEQEIGGGVVGDVHIRNTIIVEIRDRDAQGLIAGPEQAPLLCDSPELSIPEVFVALIGNRFDHARMADRRSPFGVQAFNRMIRVVLQIIADVQVQVAVLVQVPPRGAWNPTVRLALRPVR